MNLKEINDGLNEVSQRTEGCVGWSGIGQG